MIVLAALNEDSFWAPNRAFNAQKYSQGELGRRFGRLFLILNTAINQKMQKKQTKKTLRSIQRNNYFSEFYD